MIIEMGIPIIQIQTSTAVLGLALVQYHLPFNTVADLDLLCLASKATRHRSVNLLALRNPASSLLSVVHLPLTIAILVIQTKSSHPSMHPIASPENKGLPDKWIVHSSLSPHDREAKRPWSVQFWNIK
jgi:hypothetical protein